MDQKMMKLGRAKKQLRYIQTEGKACMLKINNVFTLNDLDNIFDDLDSASDSLTPQLSPVPKSDELVQQERGDDLPDLKPFGVEEPEILAPEICIQEDHLSEKESPFKEIAPIKTSSPIDLDPVGDGAGDTERQETSPILFGVEDEAPAGGILSKSPLKQTSECPELILQEDSESLVSPPARLDFGKPAREDADSVKRCLPVQSPTVPAQECQTSAPESREEPQMDGRPSRSPSVLAQNSPPESLQEEQPKNQEPELKLDAKVKESSFQEKLRNAFQSKTSWKQEAQKPQARAPSPLELEDDFMILEDDAPILFTIPRKPDTCQRDKRPPGALSAKPDGKTAESQVELSSPELREDGNENEDEPDAAKSKKAKTKRGKTVIEESDYPADKDSVAQATSEDATDPLTGADEVVPVCEHSSIPETSEDANMPGKQKRRSKMSQSDKHNKKIGKEDNQAKIPVEKPASKMKKPAKLTRDKGQKGQASSVKKKPSTTNSAIEEPVGQTLGSAKSSTQGNDNTTLNKQVPIAQEQANKLCSNTEPLLEPTAQPDVQSTTAVKKSNKQPPVKQATSKRATKVKKIEKTKDEKMKEIPALETHVSPESNVTGRRKRKPPGEWWLTSDNQNEGNTPVDELAVQQSLQELKSNKKVKRKEAPALSAQSTEKQKSQYEPNKPVSVQKMAKKVKTSNSTGDRKNTKKAGGRRKSKSAVISQQETQSEIPVPAVGEEMAVNENIGHFSPTACSPPPRRRDLTPGEKRVFSQIYTRGSQCGSAQKCPPSARPECRPEKRQRKPTSNWWEVPSSPQNCSPQKSQPQIAPPSSTFDKVSSVVSSQKTVVHAQKKTKKNLIYTPKSVRRSLATFDAIQASGKPTSLAVRGLESRQKGRRNLLHSLEDQSEQSSENTHSGQQHGSSHATFDVCTSSATVEPFAASKRTDVRLSSASRRASEHDHFRSGPSSMIELERFEEHEDSDLPSTRIIPHTRHIPRVLLDCDICSPPLRPIVLETEDWDNLCVWFAHLWPSSSKDGQVLSAISPDDFHWHSHSGRAMGHMVDLQNSTFSNGKILLGSYMKKPPHVDLHAVTVFNVVSSCVRVEIDGVKTVYNSGQAFITPCGQSYSIHNVCREPAVLWYHRMFANHTRN